MQIIKNFYKNKENYAISLGVLFALIGLSIPFTIFHLSKKEISLETFQSLGAVGDFLGGSTASFLALASMLFVVSAIIMQKEELKLQRKELSLTREELEKTRQEHFLSNRTMKLQQFENTLFNMISIHGQLINDIKYENRSGEIRGREVIAYHYERINLQYEISQFRAFLNSYINDIKTEEYSKNKIIDFLECVKEKRKLSGNGCEEVNRSITSLKSHPGEYLLNYQHSIDFHINYKGMAEMVTQYPQNEVVITFSEEFMKKNVNKYKKEAFEYEKHESKQLLSHYIKSVIAILSLIDDCELINHDEKDNYIYLFFSQFTIYEITILVYYANLDGQTKLNSLFLKYDSIKNSDIDSGAIPMN